MQGAIAALFRYPIKGFTPEAVASEDLAPGAPFAGDRLYAVENGPSGFDPAAPRFVPKQKFAVLASIPEVAKVRTFYDEKRGILRAQAPGMRSFAANLTTAAGKRRFEAWLARRILGAAAAGPLKVIDAEGHRFLDHPLGHVSILNLASLADLEQRLGRRLDPARLRANIHVAGWPAWVENAWKGRTITVGAARATVFDTITRCAAPSVDPDTAERDIDFTAELHRLYGHLLCGIYIQVERGGRIAPGDVAEVTA